MAARHHRQGTPSNRRPGPAVQPDRVNGSMGRPRPAAPTEIHTGTSVEESQLPDLQLYERLIGDGIAAGPVTGRVALQLVSLTTGS